MTMHNEDDTVNECDKDEDPINVSPVVTVPRLTVKIHGIAVPGCLLHTASSSSGASQPPYLQEYCSQVENVA